MTRLPLRAATALVTLTLALSPLVPLPLSAQDSPAALVGEWQEFTRFGLSFAVPPGAEVTHDRDLPGEQTFAVSTMGTGRTGTRLGLRMMSAADLAQAPEPGTGAFDTWMSGTAQLPVTATGAVLDLGGRRFVVYAGSGASAAAAEGAEARILMLISQQAEADGGRLLIAAFSAGLDPADALALEGQFVTGLRAAAPDATPDEAPESTPESGAEAAPDSGATPDPAASESPEADSTAQEPAAPADPETDRPDLFALLDAAITDPAGVTPDGWQRHARFGLSFAMPAGDGAETFTSPDGDQFSAHWRDPATGAEIEAGLLRQIIPADLPSSPGVPGFIGLLSDWARSTVRDTGRVLTVGAQALRLYLVAGTPEDGVMQQGFYLVAPQPGEDGALLIAGGVWRGLPDTEGREGIAAMIASLAAEAAPEAPAPTPDETSTDDWTAVERFGMRFAVPPGAEVVQDTAAPTEMEYWVQQRDAAGQVLHEISLRIFTAADRARLDHTDPAAPGFADQLSRFSGMTVRATDETVTRDGLTYRLFRGADPGVTDLSAEPRRLLYLIADTPVGTGLSPWVLLYTAHQPAGSSDRFEAAFIDAFGGVPVLPDSAAAKEPGFAAAPPAAVPSATPVPPPVSPESQAWQDAARAQSVEAMLEYLARHPRGLHSGQARAWLRGQGIVPPDERRPEPAPDPRPVDAEALAWFTALRDNRAQDLWTYLKAWPRGHHADEARAMLHSLRATPEPVPEK